MRRRSFVAIERNWFLLFAAILTLWLGACHSADGPSDPFDGHWLGGDAVYTIELMISGQSTALVGTGSVTGGAATITVAITGTDHAGTCTLTLRSPGFQSSTLTGTIANDSMYASLDGSGFYGYAVVLLRRP